ncbi:G kinase-anchoring protein 1 isoform X3 [Mastacembelus armatus]|uniref:G kinase-anchoring protein 1 isoform X3 n=1 Tax=Mastacembelus armatus TaxID=205130 RepID=UPI000E45DFBD|nr:G kinase-anchoring protein 1 isoform X3 [Mastacembelus armatus]
MASSAMITVPTTSSRFALLQIDSDSDSDTSDQGRATAKSLRDSSGKPRQGKAGGAGGKTPQGSDKKKDKKKKKKEQQQSEANEITTELYEADLEKALILSKLEYEQQKQNNTNTSSPKSRGGKESGGKKDKKKNQQIKDKKTVSLQDFQAEGSVEHLSKKQDKEDSRTANPALGIGQEERFFNKLEDDVSRIIQREKRREQYANSQGQEVSTSTEHELDPRAEQLKYELEKKDQEIDKLKKTISEWEMKYKEVKARNAQLLKMLQQGEMKDKAEILLQVEELLHIKEELSSQVTLLHGALEQERSKVKGLQSEQPKHQGNKKGRKSSEMDL